MTEPRPQSSSNGPYHVMGVTQYRRIHGSETGGAYSVMEHFFPPGAGPAFLHTHPAQESIVILDGSFEFYSQSPNGKAATPGGPGDIHHVGSNKPHGVKNVGDREGRAFIVFHPADVQEEFFEELHEYFRRNPGPPNLVALAPVFDKHGFKMIEKPS